MAVFINSILNGLNQSLEQRDGENHFEKSKSFRVGIRILISLCLFIIVLSLIGVVAVCLDEDSIGVDSYFILMVPMIFMPLIGLMVPGYIKSNQSVVLDDDVLKIDSPKGIQKVDLKGVREVSHQYFSNTVKLIKDDNYYEVSKSIRGFEHLYPLILAKTGIQTIAEGETTKVASNYYTTVIIVSYLITVFMSFLFVIVFVQSGIVYGLLITVVGTLLIWGLMAFLAMEYYVKYRFDTKGMAVIYPFSEKLIAYDHMSQVRLDKARGVVHFKVRYDDYKVLVPLGLSLEDINVYLLSKTGSVSPSLKPDLKD